MVKQLYEPTAERCVRSVYSYPMLWKGRKYTRNTHLFAYIHGRPIYGHDDRFSLIARLLLILKGYTLHMKLIIEALAISVE